MYSVRICPEDAKKDTHVFLTPESIKSIRVRNIQSLHFKRAFETARSKAGLDDVRLHDLNHNGNC